MDKFNPLDYPIGFTQPLRLDNNSAWVEHIPFGMFLIDILRPKILVELGAYTGVSYSAFCQADQQLHLDTHCYAVDTWEGDVHAGFYGPGVLADLRAHHDPLYGGFSRLVQSTFDEAVNNYTDDSIDLLHIDGLHTYEEVKHDFETWFPKLSKRAVVLFHDINVREHDFGVWKLWMELKSQFPHFEFSHGHGLGILGVGDKPTFALKALFSLGEEEAKRIQEFFFVLGARLFSSIGKDQVIRVLNTQVTEHDQQVQALTAQVTEKEQMVQALLSKMVAKQQVVKALSTHVAEKKLSVQALSAQVAERQQAVQALVVQVSEKDGALNEIYNSRAWRLIRLLREIRLKLVPRDSFGERVWYSILRLLGGK